MPAGEERKLVTILFADLVGSTALAGGEDPERVRARLDRFYDAMADEIGRTGGTVEKFAGDAVMAVFGAPAALEDHAERALHAALAMQRRLHELFGGELELRIGVNTGDTVVGEPRVGSSFVTGDAVNVCDRLQKAAEPGEILAGERTVAAASGAFEFGELRSVEAKGKPGGVAGRTVLRSLTLMRPRGVGGFPRVFVGREAELELLRATYRRAAAYAEPHLVTIVGEPGVGKTRLVRELWEVLAEEDPVPLRRTGRCLAYGDGITYWPIREVLNEHLGLRDSDRPDDILRKLEGREILGLALGLDVARELHPLDARERLHEAVVAFVDELGSARPAVVLVEDVHWAESDLLDLLERVVADVRAPVVLLATARPELHDSRPGWGAGRRNATVMWLDPLPAQEAAKMLDEMVPAVLSDELRGLLIARAEGNPFFLEELIGELVDSGVLERRDGEWSLGAQPVDFAMPDTVHAVLAARIDRLPATEKAALQAGAVVGRVFWTSAVVHLLGEDPDFDLLEERDLIRSSRGPVIAGEREYAIKHQLTREVAYASIPKARRGRIHAMLADWLESGEQGRDELASVIAYHFSEAVKREDADLVWADDAPELVRLRGRAAYWLRRAGELARRRYELDEAIDLFTRAVELSDDEHECALFWREVGRTQALRYDGEAFWDALQRSLEGPLDTAERADAYALLAFQTSIRSGMWKVRPKPGQVEAWVERALELAEEGSRAEARALLARSEIRPEVVSDEVLERISTLVERIGDPALRSYAYATRAHAAFARGRFEEAARLNERRLELLSEIDDPDHRCEAYETAVPVASGVGRFLEARQFAEMHWELARRLSAHHRVHAISLKLELAETLGDWPALAAETDRAAVAVAENLATPCVRNARDFLLCSLAYLCLGDHERGLELQRRGEQLAGEGHEGALNPPRLRMALVRGDSEAVRALVQTPLHRSFVWGPAAFATRLDTLVALREHEWIEREASPFVRPGTYVEPFALRALGAARGDDELLARADAGFAALGLEWHRSQTERLLAGL